MVGLIARKDVGNQLENCTNSRMPHLLRMVEEDERQEDAGI